jgi:hypothetical protein
MVSAVVLNAVTHWLSVWSIRFSRRMYLAEAPPPPNPAFQQTERGTKRNNSREGGVGVCACGLVG